MKYGFEIGSGDMIYISSLIKIGSGIQKFMWRGVFSNTETGRR
jgi:hypothetical protein